MIPNIAEVILQGETSSTRFERFCLEVGQREEGLTLVPTSATWDRGRDARSISRTHKSRDVLLCATLRRDIEEKVIEDLKRLAATSEPGRLIYCSSQPLTEHALDQLSAIIRPFLPKDASLSMLGGLQLAYLAENKYPGVFEYFYGLEVKNIESRLLAFKSGGEKAETRGLRLALVTLGSEDANALRRSISRRAVLEVLHRLKGGNSEGISERLSEDLRLPTRLSRRYVENVLRDAMKAGLVDERSGQWLLTKAGTDEAESVPVDAAKNLLAGRAIVRDTMEQLMGTGISDGQFEECWATLLDVLADLFHSNGFSIVSAINELLGRGSSPSISNLEVLLKGGARRIAAVFKGPDLAAEVERAVLDMFTEHTGPAFEWLATVSERFVALCSLGLESTSSQEIREILRRYQVLMDTDIILSILCDGEPNYTDVRELVGTFRQHGGQVVLSRHVLGEVAHHAWISHHDFRQTQHLLGKLKGPDLLRYVENAFARAYHFLEKDSKNWSFYIDSFKGKTADDYSKIVVILRNDLGAEMMVDECDARLANDIAQYIVSLASKKSEPTEKQDYDKASRDGNLLACMAAARQAQGRAGKDGILVLLTSSVRLKRADAKFRSQLGEPNAVISPAAFSYLLSLLPDATLGAGTLRRALFEFGETAHFPDTERLAMRVIRGTEQFNMPWARRVTLQHKLEAALRIEAEKRGISNNQMKWDFDAPENAESSAELILRSVQDMAVDDKKEIELQEAKRTIDLLTDVNANLEQKVKELARSISKKPERGGEKPQPADA